MFWKFDLHTVSQVEKLLERDDVTLKELLDEDDVLQECKAQNQRLLLFLTQDSSLQELISLIIHEPPSDREEKLRYKYANTACELLTCDVSAINDKVGGDDSLLNTLYTFLEQDPPLNPLLASFFSKTFGNLIARKTEQTISFLRKKEGFIALVLKHMDTSAMMDLLLRLISCVEPSGLRHDVLIWLDKEKLIQSLIEFIQPQTDNERQANASQALCDIIRLSRDQVGQQEASDADPLLATLELQQTVECLLKNMFDGEKRDICIVSGTQVLLALLETRKSGVELIDPGSQTLDQLYSVNNSILLGIEPYLKQYRHLLLEPPTMCSMLTSLGVLEEPFGNTRLHACRLMAALLHTRAPRIHWELCRLDMINLLLDLFFKFTWNNFLHVQMEHCVSAILDQAACDPVDDEPDLDHTHSHPDTTHTPYGDAEMFSHQDLLSHLFQTCRLVQRILDAWEENDGAQAEGGMRKGYMGHLTRIANAVVQSVEKGAAQGFITQLINGLPEDYGGRWQKFVDETLAETNKRNAVDLVFSDYQIQQMTANFVDQFGFNDDEFGEHDGINAAFSRMGGVRINLVDEGPSSGAFQACTKGKIRPFDDADEEEDIWEDKEINYAAQVKSRTRFGVPTSLNSDIMEGGALRRLGSPDLECFPDCKQILNSSRSDDADRDCSLPQSPGWVASFEDDFNFKADFAGVAIDSGSGVWGSTTAPLNDSEEKGWATFTDFQPFCWRLSSHHGDRVQARTPALAAALRSTRKTRTNRTRIKTRGARQRVCGMCVERGKLLWWRRTAAPAARTVRMMRREATPPGTRRALLSLQKTRPRKHSLPEMWMVRGRASQPNLLQSPSRKRTEGGNLTVSGVSSLCDLITAPPTTTTTKTTTATTTTPVLIECGIIQDEQCRSVSSLGREFGCAP